ncbi:hypothetical protein DIPPA_05159 [Diplonema papillatum]|nr:hypothetical protein DIPPA_05159 [Diplonema papillatum]
MGSSDDEFTLEALAAKLDNFHKSAAAQAQARVGNGTRILQNEKYENKPMALHAALIGKYPGMEKQLQFLVDHDEYLKSGETDDPDFALEARAEKLDDFHRAAAQRALVKIGNAVNILQNEKYAADPMALRAALETKYPDEKLVVHLEFLNAWDEHLKHAPKKSSKTTSSSTSSSSSGSSSKASKKTASLKDSQPQTEGLERVPPEPPETDEDAMDRLADFFDIYNPEHVETVPDVWHDFKHAPTLLLERMQKSYPGANPADFLWLENYINLFKEDSRVAFEELDEDRRELCCQLQAFYLDKEQPDLATNVPAVMLKKKGQERELGEQLIEVYPEYASDFQFLLDFADGRDAASQPSKAASQPGSRRQSVLSKHSAAPSSPAAASAARAGSRKGSVAPLPLAPASGRPASPSHAGVAAPPSGGGGSSSSRAAAAAAAASGRPSASPASSGGRAAAPFGGPSAAASLGNGNGNGHAGGARRASAAKQSEPPLSRQSSSRSHAAAARPSAARTGTGGGGGGAPAAPGASQSEVFNRRSSEGSQASGRGAPLPVFASGSHSQQHQREASAAASEQQQQMQAQMAQGEPPASTLSRQALSAAASEAGRKQSKAGKSSKASKASSAEAQLALAQMQAQLLAQQQQMQQQILEQQVLIQRQQQKLDRRSSPAASSAPAAAPARAAGGRSPPASAAAAPQHYSDPGGSIVLNTHTQQQLRNMSEQQYQQQPYASHHHSHLPPAPVSTPAARAEAEPHPHSHSHSRNGNGHEDDCDGGGGPPAPHASLRGGARRPSESARSGFRSSPAGTRPLAAAVDEAALVAAGWLPPNAASQQQQQQQQQPSADPRSAAAGGWLPPNAASQHQQQSSADPRSSRSGSRRASAGARGGDPQPSFNPEATLPVKRVDRATSAKNPNSAFPAAQPSQSQRSQSQSQPQSQRSQSQSQQQPLILQSYHEHSYRAPVGAVGGGRTPSSSDPASVGNETDVTGGSSPFKQQLVLQIRELQEVHRELASHQQSQMELLAAQQRIQAHAQAAAAAAAHPPTPHRALPPMRSPPTPASLRHVAAPKVSLQQQQQQQPQQFLAVHGSAASPPAAVEASAGRIRALEEEMTRLRGLCGQLMGLVHQGMVASPTASLAPAAAWAGVASPQAVGARAKGRRRGEWSASDDEDGETSATADTATTTTTTADEAAAAKQQRRSLSSLLASFFAASAKKKRGASRSRSPRARRHAKQQQQQQPRSPHRHTAGHQRADGGGDAVRRFRERVSHAEQLIAQFSVLSKTAAAAPNDDPLRREAARVQRQLAALARSLRREARDLKLVPPTPPHRRYTSAAADLSSRTESSEPYTPATTPSEADASTAFSATDASITDYAETDGANAPNQRSSFGLRALKRRTR